MKKNRFGLRFLIPGAVVCVLMFGMLIASGSNVTSSDPLVSLSYLTGTFQTQILTDIQSKISTQASQLESKLTQRVNGVKTASGTTASVTSTHTTANVAANSVYTVPTGSEFLFLSGSAVVNVAGLTDLTEGTAVGVGSELVVNHLYAATSSVNFKASDASKILIRK